MHVLGLIEESFICHSGDCREVVAVLWRLHWALSTLWCRLRLFVKNDWDLFRCVLCWHKAMDLSFACFLLHDRAFLWATQIREMHVLIELLLRVCLDSFVHQGWGLGFKNRRRLGLNFHVTLVWEIYILYEVRLLRSRSDKLIDYIGWQLVINLVDPHKNFFIRCANEPFGQLLHAIYSLARLDSVEISCWFAFLLQTLCKRSTFDLDLLHESRVNFVLHERVLLTWFIINFVLDGAGTESNRRFFTVPCHEELLVVLQALYLANSWQNLFTVVWTKAFRYFR